MNSDELDRVTVRDDAPVDDAIRLALEVDLEAIRAEVTDVRPEEWIRHHNDADFEGDWDSAQLRSVMGDPGAVWATPMAEVYRPTPLLERSPALRAVLESVPTTLHAVRLMRLAPGSRILEHTDSAMSAADGFVRLHIPVTTSDAVDFTHDGRRLDLRPGECWYINFNRSHSVTNNGRRPRIHLVIDGDLSDDLLALLGS